MKKPLLYLSIALNLVFFLFNTFLILTAPDTSKLHIHKWNEEPAGYIYLTEYFQGLDSSNAMTGFKYNDFLIENSFIEPFDLEIQLNSLDTSVFMNDTIIENVVFNALAFKSFENCRDSLKISKPDFIFKKLKWAEKLQNSSLMISINGLVFNRISDFWLQKISDILKEEVEKNYNVKYSFDYLYLTQRLGENKFFAGVRNSDTDKVIYNLFEGKYSYIWSRLTSKSIAFQSILFASMAMCLLVFVLGLVSIFNYFRFKYKKSNS